MQRKINTSHDMDVKKEYAKICNLIDELTAKEKAGRAGLQNLEGRFPVVLAVYAMDELTNKEVDEARNELDRLRRDLEEIPLAIEGLEAMRDDAWDRMKGLQKGELREEAEKRFELLKAEIQERYTREREQGLRLVAHRLQKSNEIEPLLHRIREDWENTPIATRGKA